MIFQIQSNMSSCQLLTHYMYKFICYIWCHKSHWLQCQCVNFFIVKLVIDFAFSLLKSLGSYYLPISLFFLSLLLPFLFLLLLFYQHQNIKNWDHLQWSNEQSKKEQFTGLRDMHHDFWIKAHGCCCHGNPPDWLWLIV